MAKSSEFESNKSYIRDFEKECWVFVEDSSLWQHFSNLNKEVYHYTTFDAFDSIVTNPSLWFSSSKSLNDPKEFEYGMEVFQGLFDFYKNKNIAHWSPSLTDLKNDIGEVEQLFFSRTLRHFELLAANYCFICSSFTLLRDDLNQWRVYSNDGNGVSFSVRLKDLISEFAPSVHNTDYFDTPLGSRLCFARPKLKGRFLQRAIYSKSAYSEKIYSRVDRALLLLQSLKLGGLVADQTIEGFAKTIAEIGIYFSTLLKNQAYEVEAEYRLVEILSVKDFQSSAKQRVNAKGQNVEYMEIQARSGSIQKLALNVWAGPTQDNSIQNDVKVLCENNDLTFRNSQIPYR